MPQFNKYISKFSTPRFGHCCDLR